MEALTYRQLLRVLLDLPLERLDDTATVYVSHLDEFYPIQMADTEEADDVLDEGHLFLAI